MLPMYRGEKLCVLMSLPFLSLINVVTELLTTNELINLERSPYTCTSITFIVIENRKEEFCSPIEQPCLHNFNSSYFLQINSRFASETFLGND